MITTPEPTNIIYFILAAIVLIVTPGPAVIFIIANSIQHGVKAGFAAVLGICSGIFVHVFAAAFGLSALLMTSAKAFMILKYLGAVYLIFLGIKSFMSKSEGGRIGNKKSFARSRKRIFIDGFIVNTFNPKTGIFFLAFLPQFISVEKGHAISQILFLGFLFVILAAISDFVFALASGKISEGMNRSRTFMKLKDKISGIIYIVLGLATLFTSRPSEVTQKN
jgi:threonine/homoserine/homoserine lactone efflux protein